MSESHTILLIFGLLQIKHLLIDWCWQPEYEWKNKGAYGHMGGIVHAYKNALGTATCFYWFVSPLTTLLIFLVDGLVHYHVDFAKMNINRIKGWGPLTHPEFWWLTGLDQAAHQLTYIMLVWVIMS